ncbi:unnamed protein product [Lota lota]
MRDSPFPRADRPSEERGMRGLYIPTDNVSHASNGDLKPIPKIPQTVNRQNKTRLWRLAEVESGVWRAFWRGHQEDHPVTQEEERGTAPKRLSGSKTPKGSGFDWGYCGKVEHFGQRLSLRDMSFMQESGTERPRG